MKKIVSLAVAGVAMLALNGCDSYRDGTEKCNTKLEYIDYTEGAAGKSSSIRLDNKSDYTIEKVYSGRDGDHPVSSTYIPTAPGEYFIANSSACGQNEILKIVDDEDCEQQVSFFRGCDETANFKVTNNF